MYVPNRDWSCELCLLANSGSSAVCSWCASPRSDAKGEKKEGLSKEQQSRLDALAQKYQGQARKQAEHAQQQQQALDSLQTKYSAQAQRQADAAAMQQAQLLSLREKYANQEADVHRQHLERLEHVKSLGKVFEAPLESVVCLHEFPRDRHPSWYLPRSILALAEFVASEQIKLSGIFTIAGSKPEVRKLMQSMDDHEYKQTTQALLKSLSSRTEFYRVVSVDVPVELNLKAYSPHVVAGVFKAFWAKLPEPILPYSLYPKILTFKSRDELVAALYDKEHGLEQPNRSVLEALMDFLATISLHSDINKSTVPVLAGQFAPLLLRAPTEQAFLEASHLLGGKEREAEAVAQVISHLISYQASVRALEVRGH